MLEPMATVGANVKRLRVAAGFTHQGKFAARAGVSRQWLSHLEHGRHRRPDTSSLMKLARAIGCSVDDLLEGVDGGYKSRSEGVAVDPTLRRATPLRDLTNLRDRLVHHGSTAPLEAFWNEVMQILDDLSAGSRAGSKDSDSANALFGVWRNAPDPLKFWFLVTLVQFIEQVYLEAEQLPSRKTQTTPRNSKTASARIASPVAKGRRHSA
jgi:HTH-type transcriptional regulator / antitoxin HipB